MKKEILLIGDFVGHGRVAITAQASVLMPKGLRISYLPTALISNNFGYEEYAFMDTTQYMREAINVWKKIGFRFDLISIGFLASDEQADLLQTFCEEQKALGAKIVVDPIMADNGHLYSGIGEETIQRLRKIVAIADLALPNYTEACYLANLPFKKEGETQEEVHALIDAIRALGTKAVLITSATVDGKTCVAGFSDADSYMCLPYRQVPVDFSGTGDIFSAEIISMIGKGRSLRNAAQITIEKLSALIDTYQEEENKLEGLPW